MGDKMPVAALRASIWQKLAESYRAEGHSCLEYEIEEEKDLGACDHLTLEHQTWTVS